jgi:hypothetical protein
MDFEPSFDFMDSLDFGLANSFTAMPTSTLPVYASLSNQAEEKYAAQADPNSE